MRQKEELVDDYDIQSGYYLIVKLRAFLILMEWLPRTTMDNLYRFIDCNGCEGWTSITSTRHFDIQDLICRQLIITYRLPTNFPEQWMIYVHSNEVLKACSWVQELPLLKPSSSVDGSGQRVESQDICGQLRHWLGDLRSPMGTFEQRN